MSDDQINDLVLLMDLKRSIFAKGLDSPRQITETRAGHIIVGSKKGNEIVALLDIDKDGSYEKKVPSQIIYQINWSSI